MAKNKDFFGFNKAINWNKLKDPKVLKELEKIFEEKKLTSERASRRDNMYKFNKDQINLIEWSLNVQKEIFTKNKLNREYYDADIRTLKECKNIINQQASEQKG